MERFTICRTWHDLTVRIYVECGRREADMTVTYQRRLIPFARDGGASHALRFDEVRTPDLANAWLGGEVDDCREAGAVTSRIEDMERMARLYLGVAA